MGKVLSFCRRCCKNVQFIILLQICCRLLKILLFVNLLVRFDWVSVEFRRSKETSLKKKKKEEKEFKGGIICSDCSVPAMVAFYRNWRNIHFWKIFSLSVVHFRVFKLSEKQASEKAKKKQLFDYHKSYFFAFRSAFCFIWKRELCYNPSELLGAVCTPRFMIN